MENPRNLTHIYIQISLFQLSLEVKKNVKNFFWYEQNLNIIVDSKTFALRILMLVLFRF